jgi:hypothetical protein
MYIYIGTIARRAKSKNIGLSKADRYKIIRAALLKYKELKGDMLVPNRFVVPVNDITWPQEAWGNNLGKVVSSIRGGYSCKDSREDLKTIGFDFNSQKLHYGYEVIKVALLKHKALYNNMLVPARFVVPVNDISWPKKTRGMNLGTVVMNIRAGISYVHNRLDLESIGFDYRRQEIEMEFPSERECHKKKGRLLYTTDLC